MPSRLPENAAKTALPCRRSSRAARLACKMRNGNSSTPTFIIMQGKPNWKQYRQQLQAKLQALRPKRQAKPNATPSKWWGNLHAQWQKLRGKLRTLPQQVREKPQLLAVAAVVAGCLLLAFGLLAGVSRKHPAPAAETAASQASAPAAGNASGIETATVSVELVTPEVSDGNAGDDPLTAAEANPEPEHALPPTTADHMNPVCETYFQRARACFRQAPDGQADALLQSLEATRGDLSQLDTEGCEVVSQQFEEMVQQMGCEQKAADSKPAEAKPQAASAAHKR
ncbi:DUF5339 domain-containing protein [Eikenella corrodens]|uniref:DUF5339 domain-containing protein n=1 Tax=Eikenella corrodens TaxID=539 RepID=UPI0012AC9799|nr:DUF5339 domain-containing protein [Eikenella corrodens]